jgi:flagellar biosynthesis/type III secretory pathway protein FliH
LEVDRRLLLVDCVESYLELNSEEAAEYARLAKVRENREVRRMATTWSQRIAAQAREEGLQAGRQAGLKAGLKMGRQEKLQEALQAVRRMLLSLLEQRFGPLSETTRQQVEAISSLDRLTRLSERALTARSLAALRLR